MQTAPRHLAALKARQPEDLGKAAPASSEWWSDFEQGASRVTDCLLAMAGVAEGQMVLDIATGLSGPATSAARRVGPGGHVVAIDRSAETLAVARENAARSGLHNMTFLELDAAEMAFPEATFDAALCRWGLMDIRDLTGILARVHRQLRPSGRLAAAVWASSPKVPLLSLPLAVIAQTLRLPPQPGITSFNLANRHALAHTFGLAGFVKVHSQPVTLTVAFPDPAAYIRYLQAGMPGLTAMLASLSPEQQQSTWQAVGDAARQRYGGPDGVLRIPGESICIVGENPAT